ncbi:hypothetical protein INS49_003488 [Diaporthe citri]|uniref:uncharacterized protein n=1 Tax=Diaporthe citri TaxID=83186 RepID=UPI001C812F3B|nr:uncharacterized protein INS49_003488 [Diaporthe citri]KAG6355526.1 hypothetical protein INS49_003488 [Diaporthe citri]
MPGVPHQTADGASEEDERAPLISRAPPPENVPPPIFAEGGRRGWLSVLGAFGVQFSTFGYATSYGRLRAWIGSIQTWALLSTSIVSGPLADRFGLQVVLWPGTAVYVLAVLMVSFCAEYWHFLLCQGLLLGISAGMIFTDAGRRSGPLILLSAFRIPVYTLQVCAMVFLFLSVFTTYVFVAEYGVRNGMPKELATYMFAIMNAGSLISRTLGGSASLCLGPFNVMVLAAFLAAISLFSWLGITSVPALVVFAAAYGALSGVLIGIMIATLGHSAPHPSQIATVVGMASGIMGTAALTGTPIAGALITSDGDYSRAILFSATAMTIGAFLFLAARLAQSRKQLIV